MTTPLHLGLTKVLLNPHHISTVHKRLTQTADLVGLDRRDVDLLVCPPLLFRRLQEAITQNPIHRYHVVC